MHSRSILSGVSYFQYRVPGVTYAELPNFILPELLCLIKSNKAKRIQIHKEWTIHGVEHTDWKWNLKGVGRIRSETWKEQEVDREYEGLDIRGVGYTSTIYVGPTRSGTHEAGHTRSGIHKVGHK